MDSSNKQPEFLNPHFKVVSYNGSSQASTSDRYSVQNALEKGTSSFHCSGPGANFDLLLESDQDVTITNIVVFKAPRCTCPIKTGAIHVYEQKPSDEDLKKWANLESKENPDEPHVLFHTPEDANFVQVKLDAWKKGKFVHVKFISAHDADQDPNANIDVGFVGLVGFYGPNIPSASYDVGSIPDELDLLPPVLKLNKLNTLQDELIEEVQSKQIVIAFEGKEQAENAGAKEAVDVVAKSGKFDLPFVWAGAENRLSSRIVDHLGFPEGKTIAAVINLSSSEHYLLEGQVTQDSLTTFITGVKEGKIPKFSKSEPRPENDRDPEHPHLYKLTAKHFDEVVIQSQKEFFVDVWAAWCGPCVAVGPTIEELAKVLSDVPTVGIGKINCDYNEVPKNYFPENGIPNMKFFSASDKQNPTKYKGDRTLPSFVQFVHDNATHKFDLDSHLEKAKTMEESRETRKTAKATIKTIETQLARFKASLTDPEKATLQTLIDSLTSESAKDAPSSATVAGLVEAWEGSGEKKKMEGLENKRVIKVHSHEEYLELIKKASDEDKITVVDFTAVWCPPCRKIAPTFADWSEQFPTVNFLKVDVDDLSETSESVGISCMPTFKFYKKGEIVASIEGANEGGILGKIKELVQ